MRAHRHPHRLGIGHGHAGTLCQTIALCVHCLALARQRREHRGGPGRHGRRGAIAHPIAAAHLDCSDHVVYLLLQVLLPYARYAHYLRWLTLSLLAYVVTALLLSQHWGQLLRYTFVPKLYFTRAYWLNLAAILGTSISPYLFFWQADQEVEELRRPGRPARRASLYSVPRVLAPDGCGDRDDFLQRRLLVYDRHRRLGLPPRTRRYRYRAAGRTGAATAGGPPGRALLHPRHAGKRLAGHPDFRRVGGLCHRGNLPMAAWLVLIVREKRRVFMPLSSSPPCLAPCSIFSGIPSMKALYYASALNGIIAPILIVAIILLANNPTIMREQRNAWWVNVVAWGTVAAMTGAAIGLLLSSR